MGRGYIKVKKGVFYKNDISYILYFLREFNLKKAKETTRLLIY